MAENNYTYLDIPEKIIVPATEWIDVVEKSVSRHGVLWTNPRYVGDNPNFPKKKKAQQSAAAEPEEGIADGVQPSQSDARPKKNLRPLLIYGMCVTCVIEMAATETEWPRGQESRAELQVNLETFKKPVRK